MNSSYSTPIYMKGGLRSHPAKELALYWICDMVPSRCTSASATKGISMSKPVHKFINEVDDNAIVYVNNEGYTVDLNASGDQVQATVPVTVIVNGDQDTVIGKAAVNVVERQGEDMYVVGGHASTVTAGEGTNTIILGEDSTVKLGGHGDDFVLTGMDSRVYAGTGDGDHLVFMGDRSILNGGEGNDTLGLLTSDSVVGFNNFGLGDSFFLGNLGITRFEDVGITIDPVHDIVRFDYNSGGQAASVTVHTNAASIFSQQGMDQVLALGEIRLT